MVMQRSHLSGMIDGSMDLWSSHNKPFPRIVLQISQTPRTYSFRDNLLAAIREASLPVRFLMSPSFSRLRAFPRIFLRYRLMAGWLSPSRCAASVCLSPCVVMSSLASMARMTGNVVLTAISQGMDIYGSATEVYHLERHKYSLLRW